MISIRRLFGLLLLFLFFEVAVWVLATFLLPDTNVLLVCAVMTGIAVAVWLIYIVVMRWTMRPRIPQAPFPRTGQFPPPNIAPTTTDPEVTTLKDLVRQAEERLAASPAFLQSKQKPRLSQVPLYLAVGSDAAGVTSALLNSGLDPRLLAGESYRDGATVPTRLCNFYYAANSIVVDIGSKIFDDAERWKRLLSVLLHTESKSLFRRLWEGHTPQQNLRGVLLFCSAATFTRSGDPQRSAALSHKTQERLETLGKESAAEFAVYTFFTKADSLPYFESFFSRLSEEEDRQILGCTLPFGETGPSDPGDTRNEAERKRLSKYFNRLYSALANKRLLFLARETVTTRKPSIYEFPREFKRIRPEITNFLAETFRPNPLHPGPRLRGFYFTGTRKVAAAQSSEESSDLSQVRFGSAATVLLKATDLRTGASPSVLRPGSSVQEQTAPRWVFLSKLFREVILPDKAWVSPPKPDNRLEIYRLASFGTLALASLFLIAGLVNSFRNNRQLLQNVEYAVRAAQASRPDPDRLTAESLQPMEALREQVVLLSRYRREGVPMRLRWGLYAGNEALPDARQLYFAQFKRVFLTPILQTLVTRFDGLNASSGSNSYDDIYERLKAYRTISSGACRPDPPLLARLLPEVWMAGRTLDSQAESLALRQVTFYVSELAAEDPYERRIPEDNAATRRAQEYLLSFKGPEQIYRGLITAVNQAPSQRPVRLSQYAPDFGEVLNGPSEVSAGFTRQGWNAVQARIRDKNFSSVGESCVVGSGRSFSALSDSSLQTDVQNLYVKDYIKTWHDFLAGQRVAPYRGVNDAVRKLGILSGNRSPLLAVLAMIADNTSFPVASHNGADELRQNLQKSVETGLGKFFPKSKKGQDAIRSAMPAQAPPILSQTDIFNVFQPVRTLINPGNHDRFVDDPNRPYINALSDLKAALDALPHDRAAALDVSLNNQARQALDKAHAAVRDAAQRFNITSAQGTDIDLTRFLEMPIDFTEGYVPKDPHKPLRDKVNGQLRAVCAHLGVLQRKFPFNPQAEAEVSEQDLAAVFAPGTGVLWGFEQLPPPLTGLLVKQGDLWMQNPAVQDPRLTPEFLDFFNRLAAVSAALFPSGATRPRLQYTVQPLASDGVQAVRINIGGTILSSGGHSVQISWPSPPDAAYVDLQLTMNGLSIPFGRYEGQWAIFRLMQDGEPQAPGSNTYLFRNLRQGHGKPQQVTNADGNAVTVRLMIEFPGAFDPRTFRAHCPVIAAQ